MFKMMDSMNPEYASILKFTWLWCSSLWIDSAGGVGASINADYLRKRLSGVNSLHLVVDGAMFVDNPEQTRQHVMRNIFKNTFYLHNIQGETTGVTAWAQCNLLIEKWGASVRTGQY